MTTTDPQDAAAILRARLSSTLNELEDRLNIPRRVSTRVRELAETKPLVLAGVAVGVVALVGAGIFFAVKRARFR